MADKPIKLVSTTQLYLDCRALLNEILDVTPNFPRDYKFTIGAEMQRLSVSLIELDAAAYMDKLAEFGLTLNPKKFYFQHYTKGVEFTGAVVKPKTSYCCNRTITNFIAAVRRLNNAKTLRQVEHAVCSINSYLGLLRHHNEYGMRKKVLGMIERHAYEYIYIKGRYEIVALKNKYKKRIQTYKRIRDGDY